MPRKFVVAGFASLALAGAALALFGLVGGGAAQAYDRYERQYERREPGWRPSPPAFHGYWGYRRWKRWNDERRDDAFYGRPYQGRDWR